MEKIAPSNPGIKHLDQVAKLDAKGREIERGVGEASARFLYRLETIDVAGPGAKTYAYFNPGADAPKFVSAYHAWRPVKDSRGVRVTSVDEILERTVLHDPQIQFADKRGDRIELRKIDLAYWALHPDAAQSYVYPVLLVDGVIFSMAQRSGAKRLNFRAPTTPSRRRSAPPRGSTRIISSTGSTEAASIPP
ncbi:MAG: hypothetical protein AB7I51_17455 [Methylocystis sp.]